MFVFLAHYLARSALIPLYILFMCYSRRRMIAGTSTQNLCPPTTCPGICCCSSKSNLNPAPLIVIRLLMLRLYFLACSESTAISESPINTYSCFGCRTLFSQESFGHSKMTGHSQGKKKLKIYLFIGLNALALSTHILLWPKRPSMLYRGAIPFLVAFAGDLKIQRDGNKFRAGR